MRANFPFYLRYCFGRTHHDPTCTPFFESWDARSRLTTPMPPGMKRRLANDLIAPVKPMKTKLKPLRDEKIVGPPAPPSSQPLPPGIQPPGVVTDDVTVAAAARPARRPAVRPPAAAYRFPGRPTIRLRRPAARRLMAPSTYKWFCFLACFISCIFNSVLIYIVRQRQKGVGFYR
ncbi:hypothetical protein PENTCL1PPCAC_963, partial [Pristionchus entomophagus]